jgi:hypothetical protein
LTFGQECRLNRVGSGLLLPSISIDQYAATPARWFGVPDREMATILPDVGNFDRMPLGFV